MEGAVFTAYTTGTLHFTGGEGKLLDHALQEVSRIIIAAKGRTPERS